MQVEACQVRSLTRRAGADGGKQRCDDRCATPPRLSAKSLCRRTIIVVACEIGDDNMTRPRMTLLRLLLALVVVTATAVGALAVRATPQAAGQSGTAPLTM